jgi:hypothetical protein
MVFSPSRTHGGIFARIGLHLLGHGRRDLGTTPNPAHPASDH